MKINFCLILLLVFLFSCKTSRSPVDEMVGHKPKEKTWNRRKQRREMKNPTAYNPYLEKKAKDKPNAQLAKDNKKVEKAAAKEKKKQLKRLRRKKGTFK